MDQIFETGLQHHIGRARREVDPDGPAHAELKRKIMQGYRILLSRAMRGVYLWFEDMETREYIESCLQAEATKNTEGRGRSLKESLQGILTDS